MTKGMTLRLPADTYSTLEALARDQGITLTMVIQKAIATEDFLYQERRKGNNILVEKADKTFYQVIFR